MKHLLYLMMSLVFIAAIIPPMSAWVVGDNYQVSWDLTVGERNVLTRAEANAACQAKWGVNANSISIYGNPEGCSNASLVASEVSCPTLPISNESVMMFTCAGHGDIVRYKDRFVLPNFNATPLLRSEPGQVNFTGSSIYPLNYSYQFGDGASNVGNRTTTHNYGMGLFTVTYRQCAFFYANDCYTITYPNYISVSESNVNFTGSPTNGSAPLSVLFTPQYLVNTTGAFWTFGDGNITAATTTPTSHLYQNPGIYTVRLDYYNNSGVSGYVQKNNYITAGAFNATSTTYAVARDLYTGFAINGAQVDMYDVQNSSWTNTTTTNGEASITTLLGHTINIYGSATGYSDDNLIGVQEVDGGYYSLLLTPTNLTTYNTTPGNLTLVVTVQDLQIPHQTLQGAEVTAAWGSQYASGTTNAAGNTFFTVPNNTAIHLSAFKSGYASGSSTHITGTANGGSTMETAIVYIGTDYVTPIPTVTWTGTGTIPPTVDPYPCIGDGSAQDTANCQRKQGSMAADLISYGPDLVKFFIMLTFIGGLLLITKR